jgi:serine/threonine protein kinase
MSANQVAAFHNLLREHRLLEPEQLEEVGRDLERRYPEPRDLAKDLVQRGWMTPFQIQQISQKKVRDLVLGPYVLLDVLGEGGMGHVYRAKHRTLGRTVALKVIRKERLGSRQAVQRFEREARAAARLAHPHIVTVYDSGEIDGRYFLAMEYVEGVDLARLVKERGPLPAGPACAYVRQAALGLQHAHERGLIHRDIKPHNLLLTRDGQTVKILDMGLARIAATDGEASELSLTQEGTVMGTPEYLAPEQARNARGVDSRADIYSLGCTLYFLLTGRPPFRGESLTETLLLHQMEEATPVEHLAANTPPAVAGVVRKMMAKDPKDRYQTANAVAEALALAFRGQPVPTALDLDSNALQAANPSSTATRSWLLGDSSPAKTDRSPARRGSWRFVGPIVALVLVGLAVAAVARLGQGSKTADRGLSDSASVDPKPDHPAFDKGIKQDKSKDGAATTARLTDGPMRVDDPLPPESTLRGMKRVTVARAPAITADYRTIGEALAKAEARTAIEILDQGPYKEVLSFAKPIPELILFSKSGAVVELAAYDGERQARGHRFEAVERLRLHGLVFSYPFREHAAALVTRGIHQLLVEECLWYCRDKPSAPIAALRVVSNHERMPGSVPARVFVQDCEFRGGGVYFDTPEPYSELVVRRNLFRQCYQGPLQFEGKVDRAVIRENVGDSQRKGNVVLNALSASPRLFEFSNNTFLDAKLLLPSKPANGPVRVVNNIFADRPLWRSEENSPWEKANDWIINYNQYVWARKSALAPLGPNEDVKKIEFLSTDAKNSGWFLRIAVDNPAARVGVGGAWPKHLGALPPGSPTPSDWFVVLLRRGQTVVGGESFPEPIRLSEPTPLAEWLRTRAKILTVSKNPNDRADFDSLQKAVAALDKGQAIWILDRGPYVERLTRNNLPEDVGIVSERYAVIELPAADAQRGDGHQLGVERGCRLAGLCFRFSGTSATSILILRSPRGVVVEQCGFHASNPDRGGNPLLSLWWDRPGDAGGREPCLVRECEFSGGSVTVQGAEDKQALHIVRNYFHDVPSQAMSISGGGRAAGDSRQPGPSLPQGVVDHACRINRPHRDLEQHVRRLGGLV